MKPAEVLLSRSVDCLTKVPKRGSSTKCETFFWTKVKSTSSHPFLLSEQLYPFKCGTSGDSFSQRVNLGFDLQQATFATTNSLCNLEQDQTWTWGTLLLRGASDFHNMVQSDMKQQLRPGGEKKQSAQWQNLWLGQKAEAFAAAETKTGSSESGSVHIGKPVSNVSLVCLRAFAPN